MAFSQGQFTIIDYNDAITLSGYLSSSASKTQRYLTDAASYKPDWSETPTVITPSLFKAGGDQNDILADPNLTKDTIKAIDWYLNENKITAGVSYEFVPRTGINGNVPYQLKIKNNIMTTDDSGCEIRCAITYYDKTTGFDIVHSLSISYSLVRDGGGLVAVEVVTPLGEVFKNNEVTELQIVSRLWRGSEIDDSNVDYAWAYQDDSVTETSGTSYNRNFGEGWHVISTTDANFDIDDNTLTVYPSAVPGMLTIQCAAIDNDPSTPVWYIDGVTLVDRSDPIEVQIISTGGNVFKNKTGNSIVLSARAYRGGVALNDAEANKNSCAYSWSRYDSNGDLDETFSHTQRDLEVKPKDVSIKSTYWCKVWYPASDKPTT